MPVRKGKVYIVGAGPGDPELISIKGLEALKKADCVLYDFLSVRELLKHTKRLCEKICVGKADRLHLKEQNEINQLLYEKALIYDSVVRLKGGDPFIFSRGYEEAKFLSKRRVSFEVIPGITSAISAPESFGIPLTIKNRLSSVAILTGRKKDIDAEIDAPNCDTLVYLMAVRNISNVVKALKESGRKSNTPCAFIERATKKDSRIIKADIATIEDKVKKFKVKPPAVLVVGEAVREAEKIKRNGAKF